MNRRVLRSGKAMRGRWGGLAALALAGMPAGPISFAFAPAQAAEATTNPAGALDAAARWAQRNGAGEVVLAIAAGGEPQIAAILPEDGGSARHRLFQIGSQTKWFTAAAIVLLEREGQLQLDDPAAKYIPELPDGEGVTIRQLLTHTSGLGDAVSFLEAEGHIPGGPVDFEQLKLLSRLAGGQFPAGERFAYNNYGYDVLGEIVQIVSGESRAAYLRRKVLQPLGMQETWFGAEVEPPVGARAIGFAWDGAGPRDMSDPYPLQWAGAAGDMVSSAHDLLLWLDALQDPANPTGLTLADFTSTTVAAGGHGADMPNYGLGVMHRSLMDRMTWGHGGFIHGYVTYFGIDQASGARFVLLTAGKGDSADASAKLQSSFQAVLGLALWANGDEARK